MNHSSDPEKTESPLPRIPSAAANLRARGLSLVAGLGVALIFYYLLYRVELPSKPFIYVAF